MYFFSEVNEGDDAVRTMRSNQRKHDPLPRWSRQISQAALASHLLMLGQQFEQKLGSRSSLVSLNVKLVRECSLQTLLHWVHSSNPGSLGALFKPWFIGCTLQTLVH